MNVDSDSWVELSSGRKFPLNLPAFQMQWNIHAEDIAHSLSRLCRYNGHTQRHYSVAEHTIVIADFVERRGGSAKDCLTALHHDSPEFVLGDIIRPVKSTAPDLKVLDETVSRAVAFRFKTHWPTPGWLRDLDNRILRDERRQVMRHTQNRWFCDHLEPLNVRLMPIRGRFSPIMRRMWLSRHRRWFSS